MKADVIVVTVTVARVAGIAMTVATAVTEVIAMIVATEKIAMVKLIQRNARVAMTVARVVAKARKRVLVIVSNVTLEPRKAALLRRMQRLMVQRTLQRRQDRHVSPERPVSHANRVRIVQSVASAPSAAHVVSGASVLSAHRVM